MPVYNKAVRDRIPETIERSGHECDYRVLSDEEYLPFLEDKLCEELDEYLSSKSLVELADIIEVIYRIVEIKGTSIEELEAIREKKKSMRGGFMKNIFLVETSN